MGKGKKSVKDLRGYATTSTPCRVDPPTAPKPVLPTASSPSETTHESPASQKYPQGQQPDSLSTSDVQPSQTAQSFPGSTAKHVSGLSLPPGPKPTAAIVSLSLQQEEKIVEVLRKYIVPQLESSAQFKPGTQLELETVYETLSEAGFEAKHIEQALSVFGTDLEFALNWLSLALTSEELPKNWCSGFTKAKTVGLKQSARLSQKNQGPTQSSKPIPKKGLVMLDDVLRQEQEEFEAAQERAKLQKEVDALIQAVAKAKAAGNLDEAKRLGLKIAELKNPGYVKVEKADESSAVEQQSTQLPALEKQTEGELREKPSGVQSEAQLMLLASLDAEDLQLLTRKPINNEDATVKVQAHQEHTVDTRKTVEEEEEDFFGGGSVFIEEEKVAGPEEQRINENVQYGLPLFEGMIPANWKRSTPKQLLSMFLKNRGCDNWKYSKNDNGRILLEIAGLSEDIQIFDSDHTCRKPSIEEELVATKALYRIFSDSFSVESQLPPDFRDLWKQWVAMDAEAAQLRADAHAKPRREFVMNLLQKRAEAAALSGQSILAEASNEQQQLLDNATLASTSSPQQNSADNDVAFRMRPKVTIQSLLTVLNSPKRLVNASLPIFNIRHRFLDLHFESDFVVIVAETGSGKTTQIPQFILEAWVVKKSIVPKIAVSEPRRVSATSVSRRISEELALDDNNKKDLQSIVAYQIRGDATASANSCLIFYTTGVLLRKAIDDPMFMEFDVMVLDEVHERSLDSDVLMVLVKGAVEARKKLSLRPLKVVLMSATINSEKLSEFFDKCPVLSAEGRTFPVTQYFLEDVVEMTGYDHVKDRDPEEDYYYDDDDVAAAEKKKKEIGEQYSERTREAVNALNEAKVNYVLIEKILELIPRLESEQKLRGNGAILVFFPGLKYIQEMERRLLSSKLFGNASKYLVIPLHSSLSNPSQLRMVFEIPRGNRKKIVLSTNIAETGVTIPDVTVVIDTCRVNQVTFNEKRGLVVMGEKFCSKSSADQRTGRAGRVQEGLAFRLVTRHTLYNKFDKFTSPEITRVPLDQVCLTILVGNVDPSNFFARAMDPPNPGSVTKAMHRLEDLGAVKLVEGTPKITSLGNLLAKLPVDVRIGKMIIYGCLFRCARTTCAIAACASAEKSIFASEQKRRFAKVTVNDSDILTEARLFQEWETSSNSTRFAKENSLEINRLRETRQTRDQLLNAVKNELGFPVADDNASNARLLSAIVVSGMNLASVTIDVPRTEINEDKVVYSCSDGTQASLVRSSLGYGKGRGALRVSTDGMRTRYFAYCERVKTAKVFLHDITLVHPATVVLLASALKPLHLVRKMEVDGWTHVRCAPRTCAVFSVLRDAVESAVKEIFAAPSAPPNIAQTLVSLLLELLCIVD